MIKTKRRESIIKERILSYINQNIKVYIIVTIMLFIGLLFGILFVNNNNNEEVSQYINNYVVKLKENPSISKIEVLKNSLLNNFTTTMLLWFLGSTIIGAPIIYLIIVYKGYCIGYTISAIIMAMGNKGILFIISSMFIQQIIFIPAILTVAVSGINLYKSITLDRQKENIKIQIIKHTFVCFMAFIFLIIEAVLEAYISGSILTNIIKYC